MKKNNFHLKRMQELEIASNDPPLFWKTLRNNGDDFDLDETKKIPQPSEWLNYFETQRSKQRLNKRQNEILECLKSYEKKKIKTSLHYWVGSSQKMY